MLPLSLRFPVQIFLLRFSNILSNIYMLKQKNLPGILQSNLTVCIYVSCPTGVISVKLAESILKSPFLGERNLLSFQMQLTLLDETNKQ